MRYTSEEWAEDLKKLSTLNGAGKYYFSVKIRRLACQNLVPAGVLTVLEAFELTN